MVIISAAILDFELCKRNVTDAVLLNPISFR
jgi:hypothetical protein